MNDFKMASEAISLAAEQVRQEFCYLSSKAHELLDALKPKDERQAFIDRAAQELQPIVFAYMTGKNEDSGKQHYSRDDIAKESIAQANALWAAREADRKARGGDANAIERGDVEADGGGE